MITLVRIRQIYIPELVIRLHALLVQSGDRIPMYVFLSFSFRTAFSGAFGRNLKHALTLSNIVADSRYGVYEDFIADGSARLEAFLKAVRLGVLKGLEEGGADPLRALKTDVRNVTGGLVEAAA